MPTLAGPAPVLGLVPSRVQAPVPLGALASGAAPGGLGVLAIPVSSQRLGREPEVFPPVGAG